ncbi:MAG: NAD(P)/FAD-dependent oxidoreductase [Candidatus Limnocylindrales bacterium]
MDAQPSEVAPKPDIELDVDCVVIGAGLAGLTVARTLVAAGREVAVLEARPRVGGRLETIDVDGFPIELGGMWVAPYQDAVIGLLEELGIGRYPTHFEGRNVFIGRGGRSEHEHDDSPLGPAATAAYEKGAAILDRLAHEIDPERPWGHPEAGALDGISFETWLRREVDHADARELLTTYLGGGFMTRTADQFSVLGALVMIAGAGGLQELLDPRQVLATRIEGGAQGLAIRIADELGDRVHLGRPVRAVEWNKAGGVTVMGGGATVRARSAVLAVPPNLLPRIEFRPGLPEWRTAATAALHQGVVNKIQVIYEEPFWRAAGLSGEGFGPGELVREVYDNSPADGSRGVLVTFLTAEVGARAAGISISARKKEILESLVRYFGRKAGRQVGYAERDWSTEPWTRGAYGATFEVGGVTKHWEAARRPIGPLRFASTDIAGVGHIHMDGAVRMGRAAAASVLAEA